MTAPALRTVLRPIANPLPLGFLALAAATLLVAALQLEWLPSDQGRAAALILLAFVFPTQLLACVIGFLGPGCRSRHRDGDPRRQLVVGGAGDAHLAAGRGQQGTRALPVAGWLAAVAMLVPAIGAGIGKLVAAAVLATTALRFAVTGGYEWTGADGWRVTAGVVGLVLCALAGYGAMAMLLEDVQHRTVLPLLRRGTGREPGVRDQL